MKTKLLTVLILGSLVGFCVVIAAWQAHVIQQHKQPAPHRVQITPPQPLIDDPEVVKPIEKTPPAVTEINTELNQAKASTLPVVEKENALATDKRTSSEETEVKMPVPELTTTEPIDNPVIDTLAQVQTSLDEPIKPIAETSVTTEAIIPASVIPKTKATTPVVTPEKPAIVTEAVQMPAIIAEAPVKLTFQQKVDQIFAENPISFKTRSAYVNKDNKKILQQLVSLLKQYPYAQLSIEGHTDSFGDKSFNLELSQRRVDAIKKYLQQQGIARHRIQAIGYGESRPLVTRGKNRRKINRRITFQQRKDEQP